MGHLLVGIHVAIGELAIIAFIWTFIELAKPTEQKIKRAKIAAILGTTLIFISWIVAGYYYVEFYGTNVKPIIKQGPMPWAHSIVMETKEHVFLFLPFLSLFTLGLIQKYKNELIENREARVSILLLCCLIVLIGFSMVIMGYIISTGARSAMETRIL
ncbi:MAG: hypothetical protein HY773_02785 [Candidatus Terrybacteria bacterium]|nr:hypothetical protein [Candidatus Terrybacteria bacterium]